MTVFTYSQARQKLAALLEKASREGAVQIKRRDGRMFTLKAENKGWSPLDIKGINTKVTTKEIIAAVRESRSL